jgi:DNA-binding response OmpR family regulator
MDGYETCQRLKADPGLKTIPVIFISALDDALARAMARAVGGLDYLTKPFQLADLEALVRLHLAPA